MFRKSAKAAALLVLGLAAVIVPFHAARAQSPQAASQKPVLTTMHRFDGPQGATPYAGLTLGSDGSFYGVTNGGAGVGLYDYGIVFKITPDGAYDTLFRFNGKNGATPFGGLVEGTDGAFYGTTVFGGKYGFGSAFCITSQGQLTTLHSFSGIDKAGAHPRCSLTAAPDGSFYGVTPDGGKHNAGTVFHMTASGTVTVLHTFTGADGEFALGKLLLGNDKTLYGTAETGGRYKNGTVFRLTAGGMYSILHNFSSDDGQPVAGLTMGQDGELYGTTVSLTAYGTLYKITAEGRFVILHKFSNTDGHGTQPYGALTLSTDGMFYGTTAFGGTVRYGTVFSMTPAGQVTTLYKFHTKYDGSFPFGGVVFGPDGALYGTTNGGGKLRGGFNAYGTIYKLTLPQ